MGSTNRLFFSTGGAFASSSPSITTYLLGGHQWYVTRQCPFTWVIPKQALLEVVRDSLEYSPEKCTIVATYKRLVVGVALLSSPQETYITYLAVRPGWDNAQIAT